MDTVDAKTVTGIAIVAMPQSWQHVEYSVD
jgi:hypothetical protein